MTDWTDDIKKRLEAAPIENNFPGELTAPIAIFIANAPTDIKNLLEEREVLREALNFKGLCECYSDEDLDVKCIRCKALDWESKK